jgi:hypothetical protein
MKLPHWAQLGIALSVVVVTWIVQQTTSGALVLPAAAVSALTILQTVLGIFSTSASPTRNAVAVAAARTLSVFGLLAGLAFVAGSATSCAQAKTIVDELVAIDKIVVDDLVAGKTDVAIVNDVEAALGASVPVEIVTDIVLNIVNDLLATGLLSKHYGPAAVLNAQTAQASLMAKKAARANPVIQVHP